MKVLVAEDDRVSMRMLQAVFMNSGHEVVATEDGASALAALQEEDAPKLAVLDWMMPEMSGVDVCRRVRQEAMSQPTYIILLTSRDKKEDIVEGLLAGANDYVTKPFDHSELWARVMVGEWVVELQSQLVARNEELERESVAKSQILATATHELKTPLTSIIGYVDRMLEERDRVGLLNARQEGYLETVRRNSGKLGALIDDLLDVSRIESECLELCAAELDVEQEIDDAVRSLGAQLEERRMGVIVDVPHDSRIKADRLRFSQVLGNLLSNACKYSPAGSTATVGVTDRPPMVQIDVADTGIGISASDQAKLFTRFFRADNSATRETSGTGLGLYIAKSLVEAHGGAMWVRSEEGAGSTFSFTMPRPDGIRTGRVNVEPESAVHPSQAHPDVASSRTGQRDGAVFEVDA